MRLPIRGFGLLLMLPSGLACTRPAAPVAASPTALQAAAVAFLARANGDKGACVQVAGGPDELTRGRVTDQLRDPAPDFVAGLMRQGITGVLGLLSGRPVQADVCDRRAALKPHGV